jgi:hypothetical protein
MTDRLSLTNALADADIDRQKAERIATEIFDAIHDNVATKTDLLELERRLDQRFAQIDVRFAQIDVRFQQVEQQIDRMVVRLGAFAVVLLGLLFGALHRWPPHG